MRLLLNVVELLGDYLEIAVAIAAVALAAVAAIVGFT
jgi:hypothetical protein